MKHAAKKTLCTMLLVLLMCVLCGSAMAASSGSFPNGVAWSLSDSLALTITGAGDVPDFSSDLSDRPWGSEVQQVTVESDVTSVGAYAFSGCASLQTVTLGSADTVLTAADMPQNAMLYSGDWGYTLSDAGATVAAYTGMGGAVVLPDSVGGYAVIAVTDGILEGMAVTEATIPADLTIPAGFFDTDTVIRSGDMVFNVKEDESLAIGAMSYTGTTLEFASSYHGLPLTGVDGTILARNATKVVLPEGVIYVQMEAFLGCNAITELVIPTTLEWIGVRAFRDAQLTALTVSEDLILMEGSLNSGTLVTVGDWVYCMGYDTAGIREWNGTDTDLVVPERFNRDIKVYSFDNPVFKGNKTLTSVTLPSGTAALCNQLFYGCTALTSVDLGDSALVLREQMFFGCRQLTSVTLPETLQTVERYAFTNCVAIKQVSLPQGVTTLGANAFRGCAALATAPLPANLTSIGDNTFYGCNSLTAVNIPDGVTSMGGGVFTGCAALTDVTVGTGLTTIESATFAGLQSLKNLTVEGSGVYISSEAFKNCTALQNVSINGANIQYNAFLNCSGLRWFEMESGSIDSQVFSGCTLLEMVTLGEGVTSLSSYLFEGLTNLKSVSIDGTMTTLPYAIFRNCTALTSVSISAPLTYVDQYAFDGCSKLESISLPSSVTQISSYGFQNCGALKSLYLPYRLQSIGSYAFANCTGLTSLTLHDYLESINNCAFAGCTGLTSVTLPSGVMTVGKGAFPATVRIYCDPTSQAAISISANGGSFVSPDSDMFGIRLLLDGDISLGLSIEQIWTEDTEIVIPEFIGGETVTELGASVFASCPEVTTVTLPASVPVIPAEMLKGNQTLKTIIIPEGVTGIGASAFQDCSQLSSVSIPSTVTSIGDYAFDGCSLLKEIQLSDKIQEIGVDAFKNVKVYCSLDSDTARMLSRTGGGFVCREYPLLKLKYLFVGGEAVSLEVVGAESGVVSVEIPDSVTSIAEGAFKDVATLTTITLPDTLTAIGAHAFENSGITAVTIPAGVTEIPEYAFADTTALSDVTVLGAVETVGDYAFYSSALKAIAFSDGLKTVGAYAFKGATRLASADLPDSVEIIDSCAFQDCSNLAHFDVPANVTEIPSYAFYRCSNLETVTIPDGVENIGSYAFYKSGLASVTLPASVKRIEYHAFYNCAGLKEVSMSGDMEYIGNQAFSGCRSMTKLTMPDTLAQMDSNAFSECVALKEVAIPAGLTEIPDSAFNSCEALTHVSIGEGVQVIGDSAFYGCDLLTSVELPTTLVEISSGAFSECGLTALTIPGKVTTIGSQAFYNNEFESIVLPDSVISLGSGAFQQCSSLISAKLSSSLTTLNDDVFYNCSKLETVTIPDGVRSIAYNTFGSCYALKAALIPASVSSIDSGAFNYVESTQLTIYCYHDSAAESLAQQQGYSIIYLDGEDMLVGLSVEAQETEINLGVGKQMDKIDELFAILPEGTPYQGKLSIYTADESIATVENGVVNGVTIGDTTLIACLEENPAIYAEITLHVRANISDFTLPEEIWQLRSEPLTLLPATTVPEGANDGYRWEITATLGDIDGNVLTPGACGSGILTATSWNGVVRTTNIHIYDEPTEVRFVNVPAGADVGTEIQLEPEVKAGAVFTGDEALHFITYSSSDDSIASVTPEGLVTTNGYGTAIITAVTENGVEGEAAIYVSSPIESFNLQGRILAPVGATIELAATEVMPATANPNAFVWTTNPEGLVSYSNGKVTVLTDQEANVTITATSWDGSLSKTTNMTIYRPAVESITFEPVEWVEPEKHVQLIAHVKAVNDFTNQLITWKVDSDAHGVSIDENGLLYTGSYGWHNDIVVTATADNGVSASMTVYVVYPTTSFEVPERVIVATGETKTITPEKVVWSNSGEASYKKFSLSVPTDAPASVEGMNITGLKPGTTELTVKSWNGVERTMKVLVYDPITEIDVYVDEDQLPNENYLTDLMVQAVYNMHSEALGDKIYTDDLLTWTSSDPMVIRVEDKIAGVIRTVNYGTATITATAENGVTGSIELTVRKEVDTFTLPSSIEAYVLSDKELAVATITPADAWDGFMWRVEPASLGTIEGNVLHVTSDVPATGRIIATSWDGYVTKDTMLQIIQVPVTAISIDPVDRLGADSEYQLTAHVTAGAEYVNQWVTFSTSDENVATVDNTGKVSTHNSGTVTITATAESGVAAEVTFEVIRGVGSFSVPEHIWLQTGDKTEVELTDIDPEDALREFEWTSSDETALTIEQNGVSAVLTAAGETAAEATVTVKSWNGTERTILVIIHEPVTKVSLSGMPAGVAPDAQIQLNVAVEAGNVYGKELVTFRSSDESVATVDENGLVTAHAYGRAEIIAEAGNGVSGSATIRVTKPIESFTLPNRYLLAAGTTTELYINDFLPADADSDAIVWTVEPAEMGVVNGNMFTATATEDMTGTVTATSWDGGVSKSTVLQIYKPQVTDIYFDEVPTLWNGAKYQLTAHVFADGSEFINELVTFSIEDGYGWVDENGVVTCDGSWQSITVAAEAENGVRATVTFSVWPPITDFTVEESCLMQVGHQKQIEILSYEGEVRDWTYKADDSGVVSVDENGLMTALKAGDGKVTVKAWSGLEKEISVHVHEEVTSVTIDPIAENQRIIESIQLDVHVMAEREYGDELVTWTTSNSRIASVSSEGLVKTLSYGEVTITATAANGVSDSVTIRVAKEVGNFTLEAEYTGYSEMSIDLAAASITPSDAYGVFDWSVEPADIGYFKGNTLYITATEACEGTLTATSWDGNVTRTALLHILKEDVTSVTLDALETEELFVGDEVQLTAHVVAGIESINRRVTWATSDENVATVDENGLMKVVGRGEATITVTSDNGLTDSISFAAVVAIESFDVPESLIVYIGESKELPITNIQPANAEDRPFTYTVNYEGFVTVEDGTITATSEVSDDELYVTVTSWNGVSRTVRVYAKRPYVSSITLAPVPEYLTDGMQFQLQATVVVDGVEYINKYVHFSAYVHDYGNLDDCGMGTIDSETGMVTIGRHDAVGYDVQFSVYPSYSGQSAHASTTYEIDLIDFELDLPETAGYQQTIQLRADNFVGAYQDYMHDPREDVTWTVEPADAVILEGDMLTVNTMEATTLTVTATSWNGLVRTATIEVQETTEIEDFTLPARILAPIGGTADISFVSITPEDAGMANFSWTIEPEGVAEVRDGRIKVLADYETTATITATSWNGVSQSTTLMIYAPNVTKIEIQPVPLWNGIETQLEARVWVDGVEVGMNEFITFSNYLYGNTDNTLENHGWGSMTTDGWLKLDTYSNGYQMTIVATAANGFSAELEVFVERAYTSFDYEDLLLMRVGYGSTIPNIVSWQPSDWGAPEWSTMEITIENSDVVAPDDMNMGYLMPIAIGETTVTASAVNGVSDTIRVVVYDTIDSVTVNPAEPMRIYENAQMTADVVLNGMTVQNKLITWSSSDESIVTVNSDGQIRSVGYGTATITATAENGLTSSTDVTVYEDTLSFSVPTFSVMYGESIELYVDDFSPEGGYASFTWTAEPADAVTIDGNILTPNVNEDMTITLTATSWDGVSRSSVLTIEQAAASIVFRLPAALRTIEEEAFVGTIATTVYIPDGCTTIEGRAFADSASLTKVYVPASVSYIDPSAFNGSTNVSIWCTPDAAYVIQYAEDNGISCIQYE